MQDILVAAIPPVVAALLAGAGVWLRNRSRTHRGEQALEEAQARVAVISSMLDQFRDDPNRTRELRADLDAAYRQIHAVEKAATEGAGGAGMGPLVRELLLLDRIPSTVTGKVVQALYYLSLAWALIWLAAAIMFGLGIAFMDSEDSFGTRIAMSFGIAVLALGMGLAPALVLYSVARMLGSSATRLPGQGRASP